MAHPGRRAGATLLAALLASRVLAGDAAVSVVLRWQPVAGAAAYEVEIARDPAFTQIAAAARVAVPGYRWQEIPSERHYWRVRSIDDKGRPGPWSEVKTIEAALAAPDLVAPADGARVIFDAESRTMPFRCRPSALLVEYLLEVARDPGFTDVVVDRRGAAPSFELKPPGIGTFHWRMRGRSLAGQETPFSGPRAFEVWPGAPVAASPAPGARVPFGPVELSWSGPPAVSRWRVAVSAPGSPPWEGETASPSIVFSPSAPGPHAWTVRAIGPSGLATASTESLAFEVEPRPPLTAPHPIAPAPGAIVGESDAAAPVALGWEAVPGAARYEVQLAETHGGLDDAASIDAPEPALSISELPVGPRIWRVRAVREDGDPGAWSLPQSFFHGGPPAAPPEIEPEKPTAVAEGPAATIRAGLRLGLRTDLLGVSGLALGVDIALRMRAFPERFLIVGRAEFQSASVTVPAQPGLSAPAGATARLFPLALLGLYEMPLAGWALYAGAGPSLTFVRVAVSGDVGVSAAVGADGLVGAQHPWGPGETFLEVSGRLGRIDGSLARLRTGGLGLFGGYRLWL